MHFKNKAKGTHVERLGYMQSGLLWARHSAPRALGAPEPCPADCPAMPVLVTRPCTSCRSYRDECFKRQDYKWKAK